MQRRRVRLTAQATDDLVAIYDYIGKKDSQAAGHVLTGIDEKIKAAAAMGLIGSPRGDKGLRVFVVYSYLIYIRVTPSHLIVYVSSTDGST